MDIAEEPLERRYWNALHQHMSGNGEAPLHEGYELARSALGEGLGVLDVAQMHQQALLRVFEDDARARRLVARAGGFFAECLSPFELSHRGAVEGVQAMRRVNELLESELQRIAHALHDEAGQLLASVHLAVAAIAGDLPQDRRDRLAHVEELLFKVEAEMRRLAHDLRPSVLDDLGLGPAVESLVEKVAARTGLVFHLDVDAPVRLVTSVETALYRVVQESVNNIVKHANARQVDIELKYLRAAIICRIRDDGIGLPVSPVGSLRGLGIKGMQERVYALGGTLEIFSQPMRGTTLHAQIPLEGIFDANPDSAR